jgi:TetR/AcrR family transcriptional regulator
MPTGSDCHPAPTASIRGRRSSGATTISDIVDAAKEEFSAHGFDATTVDAICRRAKVSKQLLYYYFGSKSDLYAIILDEAAEKTAAFISSNADAALPPEEALRRFMQNMFREFVERPQIVRMTIDEAQHNFVHVGHASPLASVLRDLIDGALAPIVERGIAAGLFRADCDVDQLFWAIHSLVTTWFAHSPMISLVTRTRTGTEMDAAAWRASSIEFVLAAVRVPA